MNIAVLRKRQIARPLGVLVPLILDELVAATSAGIEHYCHAGEMLNEAKEQVSHGSWGRWLSKNFALSQSTAARYMKLARIVEADPSKLRGTAQIETILGEQPRKARHAKWKPLKDATDSINVTRLADERKKRDDEIKLHREMAAQLIDLGYRAMATRLHPDRGGTRDAMARLNAVRDILKEIAATRRFV